MSKTGRLHHEQLSKGSRCGKLAQSRGIFLWARATVSARIKVRATNPMDDQEFKNRADQSLEALYRRLTAASDGADFEADFNSGALAIEFEEPPGKFVISPNAPVHQIWVSAHSKSYKLDWDSVGERFRSCVQRPNADRTDPGRHRQTAGRRSFAVDAGRLHFLSVLRAEVHLLQFRVGSFSARVGAEICGRAGCRDRVASRGRGSRKRFTWAAARPAGWRRGDLDRILSGGSRRAGSGWKRPSKPRRARSPRNARRRGFAPESIASAWACNPSCSANWLAPGASTRRRLSSAKLPCCARPDLANINIDLIAGLPGQTRASWSESLAWIERLQPPHVSVYMLEIDEDSRLGSEVLLNGKRYGAPDVPSDELTAEFYETAVERLSRIGIQRYEISNFARPGFESLHNLKYWQLEPYAGFGADAHSFDGVLRGQNIESPSDYVEQNRERPIAPASTPRPRMPPKSASSSACASRKASSRWPKSGSSSSSPSERFIAEGLLARDGERLRLTDRGVMFSNEVFAEFIT